MDIQSVGDRIHNIIDDQNITQTKLAKQIGIKLATLNSYMTGRTKFPPEVIRLIAEELDTSSDYLLGLTDTAERPIRLSKTEKLMIKTLRTLYRDQQEAVHNQVQFFQKQNQRE